MSAYTINCVYGSANTPDIAYVYHDEDQGVWWYVVDGSQNVNCSTVEPLDGCDVESDLYDVESFTGITINSSTQFTNVMEDHLSPETVDRVTLSIDIDSINSAFQDENASLEVVRILRKLADEIEHNDGADSKIKDVNGNNVGDFYFNVESEEL